MRGQAGFPGIVCFREERRQFESVFGVCVNVYL